MLSAGNRAKESQADGVRGALLGMEGGSSAMAEYSEWDMGHENLEIARQANEALNRGDVEGVLAFYAIDAELATSGVLPTSR